MPTSALHRLRARVGERPVIDPGLAGGLREWLEDGVAEAANQLSAGGPTVMVTQRSVAEAMRHGDDPECAGHPAVETDGEVSPDLALSAVVHALFRQVVTTGPPRGGPAHGLADGLEGLSIRDPQDPIVAFVHAMAANDRRAFGDLVADHLARIVGDWPRLPASWLPRTGGRVAIPLSGGRVVLTGRLDLTVGPPSQPQASECVVTVRTGAVRPEHRDDLSFLHLMETVRSGASPWRAATYYTATGELVVDDADDEQLAHAVERAIDGARRQCRAALRPGDEQ